MPDYDVAERHEITIEATAPTVYRALKETNFAGSPVIAGLMLLRGLHALIAGRVKAQSELNLDSLTELGFTVLAEEPPGELVLGVAGRFWRPAGNIEPVDPPDFEEFNPSGMAKAVMSFWIEENEAGCLVVTETRVACTDEAALRKFLLYWKLIGPFSGLIRVLMLRMIRRSALQVAPMT